MGELSENLLPEATPRPTGRDQASQEEGGGRQREGEGSQVWSLKSHISYILWFSTFFKMQDTYTCWFCNSRKQWIWWCQDQWWVASFSQLSTVVPGFRVLGFRALSGFRAQNPGDRAWSVHKRLFGFKAPPFWPLCPELAWVFGEI